jgi:Leucine-rich repeat (LRR) protein
VSELTVDCVKTHVLDSDVQVMSSASHLRKLSLTCKLIKLPSELFVNLKHLEELDLSNNNLDEVPPVIYTTLSDSLEKLDLFNNKIKVIPEGMRSLFRKRSFMANLGKNPLVCNCSASWLLNVREQLDAPQFVECGSKGIEELTRSDFGCPLPSTPATLATSADQRSSQRPPSESSDQQNVSDVSSSWPPPSPPLHCLPLRNVASTDTARTV